MAQFTLVHTGKLFASRFRVFVRSKPGSDVLTRLNAASVFVSRRMRLLVMAVVVIGCLKMGLGPQSTATFQSQPVHAGVDIQAAMQAERAQSPDKD